MPKKRTVHSINQRYTPTLPTSVAVVSGGASTAADISDFDEAAQDAVGTILVDSATVDFTYTDATPAITAAVIDDSISNTKLRNSGALSVVGRSANSTGDPADISATAATDAVLRENASTIGFGTIATGGIAASAVTNAKLANMVETTVKGRATGAGTGSPVDLTAAELATILGTVDLTMADAKFIAADTVQARDSGGLLLKDDGGNLGVAVEDGGQVGIGTSTPSAKLNISLSHSTAWALPPASDDLAMRIENPNASADFVAWQFVNRTSSTSVWLIAMEHQNNFDGDMAFVTRTGSATYAERLRFLNNGRVGIGTAAPGGILSILAGASTDFANVGGVLYVTTTQTGNVTTGEDDLASFSVPANTLGTNLQTLIFEAWGTLAANTNAKILRARFGTSGTALMFTSPTYNTAPAGKWYIRGTIVRTGAATQKSGVQCVTNFGTDTDIVTSLNQTLSGAVTLKVTGEGVASNDLVLEYFKVSWEDANT